MSVSRGVIPASARGFRRWRWRELVLSDWVLDFLYPHRCPLCDRALRAGAREACPECRMRVEYVREPRCEKCGKPLEEEGEFCADCRRKTHAFDGGNALFVYRGAVKESLARLKYQGRREYAPFFAQELYRQYGGWLRRQNGCLVPVPLHRKRYRKRGYNQAALIAGELAALSGIAIREDLLVRVRDTVPQKELSGKERSRNLSHAFLVKNLGEELNRIPECVILIDDIYTTGSTLDACSVVLKKHGVQRVYFLCVSTGEGY